MMAKIVKLPGGATLLYRRRENNKAAYLKLYYNIGAANTAFLPGILHYGEHIRCLKTAVLTEEQVSQLKDKIDMGFNAATSIAHLAFYLYNSVPKLKESLKIMTDCMLLNEIDDATFERERKVIFSEIERALDNDDRQMAIEMNQLCSKNPAWNADVLGTKQDVATLTQPQVQEHISSILNTHNLIACVVGNLSLWKTKRLLKKLVIRSLDSKTPTILPQDYHYDFNETGATKIITKDKASTSVLLYIPIDFFGKFNGQKERLMFSNYVMPLLNGRDGLISKKLRRQNGIIYAHNENFYSKFDKGYLSISYKTNCSTVNQSLDLVASALQEINLTKSKFKELKKIAQIRKDKRTQRPFENWCDGMIGEFVQYGKFLPNRIYNRNMRTIRVKQVNNLMNRLFSNNRVFAVFFGSATPSDVYTCEQIQAKFFPKKYPSLPSTVEQNVQNSTNTPTAPEPEIATTPTKEPVVLAQTLESTASQQSPQPVATKKENVTNKAKTKKKPASKKTTSKTPKKK